MSDVSNSSTSADGAAEDRTGVRDPLRDQFVRVWGPVILKIARRSFGFQDADAADIVQETCALAITKRAKLPTEVDGLSRWIASAAWKLCWNAVRKGSRESSLNEVEIDSLSAAAPVDVVESAERAAIVHLALDALPKRYALILRLMFFAEESQTYEQLAEALGIKVGSVGSLRIRAIKRMEKELLRLGLDG